MKIDEETVEISKLAATEKTKKIVEQLDSLLEELCPEIPSQAEIQIFLDEDGYNVVLLTNEGQEREQTLVKAWNFIRE